MTVANVILENMRVRLVSDTVGYVEKDPVVFHRKMRIVENAGLVFIVRGRVALADDLEAQSITWTDFADAASEISATLQSGDVDHFQDPGLAEVSIVGWDPEGPKFTRLMAKLDLDGVHLQRVDMLPGAYLAPSLGAHALPGTMTDEQLLKVAILQQEIAIRHGLNVCIGGDVEVATVDARGIVIHKLGEYPNKQLTAARIKRARVGWTRIAAA